MTRNRPPLLKKILLAGVCSTLLAGCAWLQEWEGGKQAKAPQPQPQATLVQTADATWIKPTSNQEPMEKLVPAPDETTIETRERLESMEQQLAGMQNDMKMIMPALTRLAALQVNLQELTQMQPAAGSVAAAGKSDNVSPGMNHNDDAGLMPVPLVQQTAQAAPAAPPAAVSAPVQPQPEPVAATAQPVSQDAGTIAQDVRFGIHPDKTRIVIDVSSDVEFTYNIDNENGALLIDMPGTQWRGATQAPVGGSALVASYAAASNGQGGAQMAVQLRQPVKVLWAQALAAVDGKGPRLVIDVAPL